MSTKRLGVFTAPSIRCNSVLPSQAGGSSTPQSGFPSEIEGYAEELTAIRRDLHAHPELGFEELRTSGIVADLLIGMQEFVDYAVEVGVLSAADGDL